MTNPRQLNYLNAMGIPVWVSREYVVELDNTVERLSADVTKNTGAEDESPCAGSASSIIKTLNDHSDVPLKDKNQTKVTDNKLEENTSNTVADLSAMDWQALQQKVSSCQQCELHKNRTNTVFGSGHQQADWMIIGDAPASLDDQQGQPFTDQAGQLMTNMLRAIGLKRNEVYITNLLKCRPPNNRDPEIRESASCNAYLQQQLVLLKPKIVLVFGQVAAQSLLQSKEPLARLRGKVHQLPGTNISLVATYHPAYLLTKTTDKRKAWDDLKLAKQQFET